jgi:DinB superfamily
MTDVLAETTDLLARTPIVLRALLADLPESWAGTPDVEDGWRPRDVVGHLVTADLDDWIPRINRILDDGPTVPFDPFDRFAHVDRDRDATLDQLLERFAGIRRQSLAQLSARVTEADLDRPGRHAALGEVSLRELLATWAVHDLDHSAQIFAGMAGSHDADVGPWKAYLGILLRRDDPAAVPG